MGKRRVKGRNGSGNMIPFEMKEVKKIGVTIYCESKEKRYDVYLETDTLFGATRIVNTFKPKRNYEVKQVVIEEVGKLV
jgi:hypothetical protein